jgi:hypothetical protein
MNAILDQLINWTPMVVIIGLWVGGMWLLGKGFNKLYRRDKIGIPRMNPPTPPSMLTFRGGDVQGKWRWFLFYGIAAWIVIRETISAFRVPWRWSLDQCLFAFLAACAIYALGYWGLVWRRGGMALVRERLAARRQRIDAAADKNVFLWSLAFWLVVAIALVVMFHITQLHR